MKKWIFSAILVAILFFGTVIGFNMFKAQKIKEYMANRPIPEFSVTVTTVKAKNWEPHLRAIGFIEPNEGVGIANEVQGTVVSINFKSGQHVKKGDVLISLDSTIEQANLKSAQAKLPASKLNYNRMRILLKKGSISEGDVDTARADFYSLKSQIEALRATINQHDIVAPFNGIVGLRNAYMGSFLNVGTTITRLENLNKMLLRFTIAQNDLHKIYIGQKMNIFVDALPHSSFSGTISAIEPAVNYQSGVIQVQATIPNEARVLRSGMFAKANIVLPIQKDQITLPETAINYTLYGETVYILTKKTDKKNKTFLEANQKIVKLGESQDTDIHILSGLSEGDIVVTSGQVRLSNGVRVKIIKSDILNKPAKIPAL
ncbi:MAG: efflux RND transporter periplasmic adaptor subunit [Psychromonas sp.]|nr:efflux RND transporter periplasmic adaptor subunit [Psychromonas sp.]